MVGVHFFSTFPTTGTHQRKILDFSAKTPPPSSTHTLKNVNPLTWKRPTNPFWQAATCPFLSKNAATQQEHHKTPVNTGTPKQGTHERNKKLKPPYFNPHFWYTYSHDGDTYSGLYFLIVWFSGCYLHTGFQGDNLESYKIPTKGTRKGRNCHKSRCFAHLILQVLP